MTQRTKLLNFDFTSVFSIKENDLQNENGKTNIVKKEQKPQISNSEKTLNCLQVFKTLGKLYSSRTKVLTVVMMKLLLVIL